MNYEKYEENFLLFNSLFEEGFNRPNLKTQKFIELWYDVILLMSREMLSGPFYNIKMYYNCDYIFKGENVLFKEIRSCEDFLNWCLNIAKDYNFKIQQLDAIDSNEEDDKTILLIQAEAMIKLSYMAYEIQKDRWKFINKSFSNNTSQLSE